MILSRLRRAGLLVGPVALVLSMLVVAGTTDWWHQNDTDEIVAQSHDHASHHPLLKSPRGGDSRPGEHCYLCHWLRSFQNGLRVSGDHVVTTADLRHVQPAVLAGPHEVFAATVPARAPPV